MNVLDLIYTVTGRTSEGCFSIYPTKESSMSVAHCPRCFQIIGYRNYPYKEFCHECNRKLGLTESDMIITIDRFCNRCGKRFQFTMEEREFRQLKDNIEYCCGTCEYQQYEIPIRKVGSYERLDQLYERRMRT